MHLAVHSAVITCHQPQSLCTPSHRASSLKQCHASSYAPCCRHHLLHQAWVYCHYKTHFLDNSAVTCRITFEKEGVRQGAGQTAAPSHGSGASSGSQIAIGQTYIPSHLDREAHKIRHHYHPQTNNATSRPQPTVVSPNGDEIDPDGTVHSQHSAAAGVEAKVQQEMAGAKQKPGISPEEEQALKSEVQRVAEAISAEGTIQASNPAKARVQSAWDLHYKSDQKEGDAARPSGLHETSTSSTGLSHDGKR